jgi:hypothetical protein
VSDCQLLKKDPAPQKLIHGCILTSNTTEKYSDGLKYLKKLKCGVPLKV